jgi:hypothetical protein
MSWFEPPGLGQQRGPRRTKAENVTDLPSERRSSGVVPRPQGPSLLRMPKHEPIPGHHLLPRRERRLGARLLLWAPS